MDTTELETNGDYWFQLWNGYPTVVDDESRFRDALSTISGRRSLWYRVIEVLNSPVYKELCEVASVKPPPHSFPLNSLLVSRSNPANESQFLNDVIHSFGIFAEGALLAQEKNNERPSFTEIPTTLNAIERNIGRQLVCRGYANTVIALYMLGLIDTLPSPRVHHAWLFSETV